MLPALAIDIDLSPDISHLVIEDDAPVDNLISEKQLRLLTETLYSTGAGTSRAGRSKSSSTGRTVAIAGY